MSSLVRVFSFLVCAPLVRTEFSCPTNYAFKDGTCSGAASTSCNAATCCKLTGELCSSKNAISGDAECKKDNAKYFYDLGKTGKVYASGGFKSSCCTACSAATCGDWKIAKVLVGCPSGQTLKDTNALGSNDCSIPSDADYKSKCCVAAPTVCSSKGAIMGDGECKSGGDKHFYDLKKGAQTYTSNGFKSACCTSCSQATCADWGIVKALVGCPSGQAILGTNSLGSNDCSIPSNADYKSKCCAVVPSVCSSKGAIMGDGECKSGGDKHFYDLKKGAQTYTSTGFKSACCTSCSQATCADWGIVKALVGCPSGQAILGTNPLGSSDCSIPSDADYKSSCCVDLMTCAKAEGVSGAFKLEGLLPWWVLIVSAIIRK